MITVRNAHERGRTTIGWLDSRHTFSFGQFYDPANMGFGPLRVINDDVVRPGAGFGEHGHADMEIISYVLRGALEHRDSLGSGSVIRPGDVQRMSAGTGIRHSEFNHSRDDDVRFLQIWIEPERKGITPGYEQKSFDLNANGRMALVASRDGRMGSLTIHCDIDLYAARLSAGQAVAQSLEATRQGWFHVATGSLSLNDVVLSEGDGAALRDETILEIITTEPSEILLFDMA